MVKDLKTKVETKTAQKKNSNKGESSLKRILLRLDLNVPIDHKTDTLLETERIDAVLPEIKKLAVKNKLVIASHLGKGDKEKDSIKPVATYIRSKLSVKANQNVEILENLRFLGGETAKVGSKDFIDTSKYLAEMCDEYICDAFATMHRPHASIVGVPEIFKKKCKTKKEFYKKVRLGSLVQNEMKHLDKILLELNNKNEKQVKGNGRLIRRLGVKQKNILVILSGAKISTKLPLILKFLNLNAKVYVAGGIANQLWRDVFGYNIGLSFYEEDFKINVKVKASLREAIEKGKLILPSDVLLNDNQEKSPSGVHTRDRIVDIGRFSVRELKEEINKSEILIMNGPLGVYEEGFNVASKEILEYIDLKAKSKTNLISKIKNNKRATKGEATKSPNFSALLGGGDTLVLTKKLNIKSNKNLFISTGGGAMLEYLERDGDLPGIRALE